MKQTVKFFSDLIYFHNTMKYFVILLILTSVVLISSNTNVFAVPIEKVPISSFEIYSNSSGPINEVLVGKSVDFVANITNTQNTTQSFVYAIWITNQNDERIHEDWIEASLEPKTSFTPFISWIPTDIGRYTINSSVWQSVDNPTAFSAIWESSLEVLPKTSEKNADYISPLEQFRSEISANEIKCRNNLILIQKYDGTPACVKLETKQKLIERGWAKSS